MASINNVYGNGIARIIQGPRGLNECHGVLVADNIAEAMLLMNSESTIYTGLVSDSDRETTLSFPVIITTIQSTRIEFTATGNPYQGVDNS